MRGTSAEMLTAAQLALAGHAIFRPLTDNQGIDLLVGRGAGWHLLVHVKPELVYSNTVVISRRTG